MFDPGPENLTSVIESALYKNPSARNPQPLFFGPITVWGLCPHHLLPVKYKVWVGYKPMLYVTGISKIPRVVKGIFKVPRIQELSTVQLCKLIHNCKLNPGSTLVRAIGLHTCAAARGVQVDCPVVSFESEGIVQSSLAQEFLQYCSTKTDIWI